MKRSLMRPSAALLPLGGMIAALLGRASAVCTLFALLLGMDFCTLCAASCFRNAAVREPGVRRLDRRFGGAIAQCLLGLLLFAAVFPLLHGRLPAFCLMIAAACIIIEQLFEERIFALVRPIDGAMIAAITAVLLPVGLLIDGMGGIEAPVEDFYTACAAALSALIAAISAFLLERGHAFSLLPRNYRFAPKAVLQAMLYPALAVAGLCLAQRLGCAAEAKDCAAPALAGFALWRLSRTAARRSADESRSLNLLIVSAAALFCGASIFFPPLLPFACALTLAMLCALAVFCAPSLRVFCGAGLTLVALGANFLPPVFDARPILCCACALNAVLVNLKHAFLRRV